MGHKLMNVPPVSLRVPVNTYAEVSALRGLVVLSALAKANVASSSKSDVELGCRRQTVLLPKLRNSGFL
jgi:hypothetical protein